VLALTLSGADTNTLGIGANTINAGTEDFNITSQANAVEAMGLLTTAIETVNSLRSDLGAAQNRIDFTVATLAIQEENSAASESAIRDADMARETIDFTRNQILVSAGTAVLAQANIIPQTALQLLGG
jgi:flagellin